MRIHLEVVVNNKMSICILILIMRIDRDDDKGLNPLTVGGILPDESSGYHEGLLDFFTDESDIMEEVTQVKNPFLQN